MQAVAIQRIAEERERAPIQSFPLGGILGEGKLLAVHTDLGTVSLLENGEAHPRLLLQQRFTSNELSLLLPLLQNFPDYCPYEVLYASFYHRAVGEEMIEKSRMILYDAAEAGVWDAQMRPLRNVLSRIRFKLRGFHFDIVSILETGYVLLAAARHR